MAAWMVARVLIGLVDAARMAGVLGEVVAHETLPRMRLSFRLVWLAVGLCACSGSLAPASSHDASAVQDAGSTDSALSDSARIESGVDTGHDAALDAALDAASDAGPPFHCDQALATGARLGGDLRFDPADPHPGDTLTVTVLATDGTGRTDAPAMTLRSTGADGTAERAPSTIEGGAAISYFAVPDLKLGDLCLEAMIGGEVEASARVAVTPRPPGPSRADGIFRVMSNHQWTCAEQPEWGNFIDVEVHDADGSPMAGVVVRFDKPATTVDPIRAADTNPVPDSVVTRADGKARVPNYWPINANGLMVFNLSLDGRASDVATEITSGWWGDNLAGCNYCPLGTNRNVWGHWSYTVVFQRDPAATEECVVPSDHASMVACGPPRHIHHDSTHPACW